MNRREHMRKAAEYRDRAERAHDLIWNHGRFDTVEYAVQPIFEATSPLRFIVMAKYTIKIDGEAVRSEGPIAAFVHRHNAEAFVHTQIGPLVIKKQMA